MSSERAGAAMGGAAVPLPWPPREHMVRVLAGDMPPVTPRNAATVMLLRPLAGTGLGTPVPAGTAPAGTAPAGTGPAGVGQDGAGLQVYLLRRTSSMAFAPGAYVFPGGSVDAGDAETDVRWAGPGADEWGELLGAPPVLAHALVCAAVRETFEESGVLLAGPAPDAIVPDTSGPGWEADRRELLAGTLSLAGLLRRRDLVLRSDLLRPWARWITPVTEERRYDTRFFVAAMPAGQLTRDVGGEADRATWLEPAAALAAASRKEIALLPPTAITLAELNACGGVRAALAAPRRVTALMPEVTVSDGVAWLNVPAGLEYPL